MVKNDCFWESYIQKKPQKQPENDTFWWYKNFWKVKTWEPKIPHVNEIYLIYVPS